jgi:hypothetical protein
VTIRPDDERLAPLMIPRPAQAVTFEAERLVG